MMTKLSDEDLIHLLGRACETCATMKEQNLLVSDGLHAVPVEDDEHGFEYFDCPDCVPLEKEAQRRGMVTRGFFGEKISPLDDPTIAYD
jgi:hypothetical protein